MLRKSASIGPLLAFLWLFLATVQIKVDGEEAVVPYFRFTIFAALPFALLWWIRGFWAARFTTGRWIALLALTYLMLYPVVTLFFGELEVRALKDAAYTIAIYLILVALVKACFTGADGHLDFQRLSHVCILLAVVESVLAIAVWFGFPVYAAPGTRVVQQVWLDGRLHGVMGTSSHLAPVVAIGLLFVLRQERNAANALIFGFLVITLIMTGSRGALIGFLGAVGMTLALWTGRMRVSAKGIVPSVALLLVVAGASVYFADASEEIAQMAVRVDPEDWEKSRSAMWVARLSEFEGRSLSEQLFGAGHRSIDQTFNANVEYLVNLGLLYTLVINGFFLAIITRFFFRAWAYRAPADTMLLAIAVFTYLFSQGINYTFYKFVHLSQLAMVILIVGYFERRSAVRVQSRQPVRSLTPALGDTGRTF